MTQNDYNEALSDGLYELLCQEFKVVTRDSVAVLGRQCYYFIVNETFPQIVVRFYYSLNFVSVSKSISLIESKQIGIFGIDRPDCFDAILKLMREQGGLGEDQRQIDD